jgi:hypothetical protein
MYFYIYDSFLTEKKYFKIVSKIETRLASLDISGKKYQLSILKSAEETIKSILNKESSTIVVVGGDKTFCQAALSMAGTGGVLGFIPVQENSNQANILGLPGNEYACDVISARRIEEVSLGKINDQYFFSSLEFDPHKTILTVDNKYQIIPRRTKIVKIINLDLLQFGDQSDEPDFKRSASNPKDDYLEVLMGTPGKNYFLFKKKEKRDSLFFIRSLKIRSKKEDKEVLIKVDQTKIIKAPATIETAKEKIKIIVGKDRLI